MERESPLKVGSATDPHERDADAVAEQVLRTSETELPQPSRVDANTPGVGAPSLMHSVLAKPGFAMDATTRAFFEPHFRTDLSAVRIHADADADASARAVGATAYAVGSHLAFAADAYAPSTTAGRRLLAHELAHVLQQDRASAPWLQRQVQPGNPSSRRRSRQPTTPTLHKVRPGVTDRIDEAYGAGSLDETTWRALVADAEQAIAAGSVEAAKRRYLTLYADVAKLAQATRVVVSGDINVVTGNKNDCRDARPGLNLSLSTQDQWGASGTTGFVDDHGRFGVNLSSRGTRQPMVAIILSRSAFKPAKQRTLAVLRHEMVHAELNAEDAANALRADPSVSAAPARTSRANSEVLGYIEGFMTMFHLTHPAPTSAKDPAFIELLGALEISHGDYPWADSGSAIRSEALGRLEEYCCHELDAPHRLAFQAWVDDQLSSERARDTERQGPSFFWGLRRILANPCNRVTPMKL